jgi:hypothetical protein
MFGGVQDWGGSPVQSVEKILQCSAPAEDVQHTFASLQLKLFEDSLKTFK